jgi:hypothetical protein
MRFLMTTTKADPPDEKLVVEMDRLVEEMTRKGVLLAAGGLDPVGTHVTSSGGKITVTDGPFTESKELVSYALYDVRSREDAIEWASRFVRLHRDLWPGWEGQTDILQVMAPQNVG